MNHKSMRRHRASPMFCPLPNTQPSPPPSRMRTVVRSPRQQSWAVWPKDHALRTNPTKQQPLFPRRSLLLRSSRTFLKFHFGGAPERFPLVLAEKEKNGQNEVTDDKQQCSVVQGSCNNGRRGGKGDHRL